MDGLVNFYEDQVGWYHAYNDDALVVAHVLGYQLYERNGHEHAIGFPIEVLKKVAKYLSYYNIGYNINNINIIEYPNSQYDECLKNDFHRKYVCDDLPIKRSKKEVIRGKFVIQYNDEELLEKLKTDHSLIITWEDGELWGGYGQQIASYYGSSSMKVFNFGLSKKFHSDFNADELLAECGVSQENLIRIIKENLK